MKFFRKKKERPKGNVLPEANAHSKEQKLPKEESQNEESDFESRRDEEIIDSKINISVYSIKAFVNELSKKPDADIIYPKIIKLIREGNVVLEHKFGRLQIYHSLTLPEANYLERQLSTNSELDLTHFLCIIYPVTSNKNKKKSLIEVHHLVKVRNHQILHVWNTRPFDSLMYLKDSVHFQKVQISQSNLFSPKNIPKFFKFEVLANLDLDKVNFGSKSFQQSFFKRCEDLENLTNFRLKEKNAGHRNLITFVGFTTCNEKVLDKDRLWGLFQTKKKCRVLMDRAVVADECTAKYLISHLKNMKVRVKHLFLQWCNSRWERSSYLKYLKNVE